MHIARSLVVATLVLSPALAAAVPPGTPDGVVATAAGCTQVSIGWNASAPGDLPLYGYKLYRNGVFFRWVLTPATTGVDRNVSGGTAYSYTVVAVDNAGYPSPASLPASVSTPACPDAVPPLTPSGLTGASNGCSGVSLSWAATTDSGGSGLRGYRVYRNGTLLQQVLAPATSVTDRAVVPSATYSYSVSAFDGAGNESSQTGALLWTLPPCTNLPPVASAGPDQATQTLVDLAFSAAGSSDPDDGIASFAWSFGDGASASGSSATHRYARAGIYTVTLTVADHGGLTATDTARVTIANRPPVAVTGPDQTAGVGTALTLADAGSYDRDGSIASYRWTFGDGAAGTGATTSHAYQTPGVYTATLTVTDDLGAQAASTCVVTVTSTPPPPPSGGGTWLRRLGGAGADIGQAIAAAVDGGVVVAGRLSSTTTQAMIAKFSASGTQVWARTSTGAGAAEVYGIAVDRGGDVFVTGWFQGTVDLGGGALTSAGGTDLFVAKYRGADGGHLWSERFGGTASDIGYGLAADGDGVVVTGFFQGAADLGGGVFPAVLGGVDTFVARYASADGHHLWSRNLGGASDDIGYGVAADGQGGVLVTGFFRSRMNFGSVLLQVVGANDIFLAKLRATDGQTVWARGFGGTLSERGYEVAVDGRGDVVVTGFFQGTLGLGNAVLTAAGSTDAFVAKCSGASGAPVWARGMGSLNEDYGFGVAVDGNGDVVLAGRFKDTVDFGGGPLTAAGTSDGFLARYAGGTGAHLASRRIGGAGFDVANGVAAVGTRAVVTGSFEGTSDLAGTTLVSAGSSDVFLLSLVP